MNHRLREIGSGIRSVLSACAPRLRNHRVSCFNNGGEWIQIEVMAYNKLDAADKVGKQIDKKLRPSYNCFVVRVFERR